LQDKFGHFVSHRYSLLGVSPHEDSGKTRRKIIVVFVFFAKLEFFFSPGKVEDSSLARKDKQLLYWFSRTFSRGEI